MKKIKSVMFAFVLAGLTLVSCSSDDSGPAPTIEGKWNQVKTVVKITNGGTSTIKYDEDVTGCDKNYLEFVAGGTFKDVVYFKQGGDCQMNAADNGTWAKTNEKLIIANGGHLSGSYDIQRLTNGELQIGTTVDVGGIVSTTTIFMNKAK